MELNEKLLKLKELTNQFQSNIKQYKSNIYDEANTRVDFIDKFFELLDWDVRNLQGYSEQYREVIREDKIQIEGKQKAPDYSFRIGKERKFFVEAKKPSVNLKDDIEPAFQVRRYGYTAKLPLSILTDFEEFAIYDTRIKPDKNDKASVGRVFYCTCDEYEKHFEFIYETFSKNAILKGSFDKYIDENKNKKGTSEVDKELLKLVEDWRTDLAKNIALRNNEIDIYNLNNAVQKIIDRLIFLRIAEDKEIENYEQLLLLTKSNDIFKNLNELFVKANKKYNAGLFKPESWLAELKIDDKVLSSIIKGLYYPECPYEFSILPIEILGNIYEQFLGKTIKFRNVKEGHTAVIEEKPEVRKAGGVYYTPQYIVNYIVENTIGEKIKDKTPDEVAELKVCDPACGSGSFLVGAYQFLLNYHIDYYTQEKNIKKALKDEKIFQIAENNYKLTIEEKQKILTNNIHGVDIDPQAVEVTKLSLYLKLLENEGKEAEGSLFKHSDLKLLPTLDRNIKCGNSLIGSDFYSDKDLTLFGNDEMRKVNVFDWNKQYPDIFKNGGFDVVIGNPPYVRPENVETVERNYYLNSSNYTLAFGRFDLYIIFVEKGLKLLKDYGLFGYIMPSSFYNQNYSKLLREYILSNMQIDKIIDLSDLKVFQNATVQTTVFILENKKPDKDQLINISLPKFPNYDLDKYSLIPQSIFLTMPQSMIRTNLNDNTINIVNKIKLSSTILDNICYVVIGSVPHDSKTGASKDRLISTSKTKESHKKYIEGKDMGRYILNDRNIYLDYQPKMMHRPKFPELFENKKIIIRNISTKEGILAVFDSNHFYVNDTVSCCLPWHLLENVNERGTKGTIEQIQLSKVYDLKFLLGIINSKLINFYFKNILSSNLHVYPEAIRNLPIIKNFNDQTAKNITALVDQMLETQNIYQNAKSDNDKFIYKQKIDLIDNQIDRLVYELYELTDEEIKIVENVK